MSNDWVLQYEPFITRALRRWAQGVSTDDLEDMHQDCYVHLLEKADKIQQDTSNLTKTEGVKYVSKVLKNYILGAIDKRDRKPELVSEDEVRNLETAPKSVFAEMIAPLPTLERDVLTAIFRDHIPHADIAKRYGHRREWVTAIKTRAIKRLGIIY